MPADNTIVRAAIYPPIGVARVGNSLVEFFTGPEVPNAPGLPPGGYKDASGALLRQAARFHLYGYNAAGEVVAELTPANADIEWTVHLANKKAAWYEFYLALDIPEASAADAPRARRRNAMIRGADRSKLVIDPGPRSISGINTSGPGHHFDTGTFFQLTVPLGELRTDGDGCLLVLGGHGHSRSYVGQPPQDFANNDGWHDDVSDGPVDAKVTIGGRAIPVEGAWVLVGPPNYAPTLKTARTLYDFLHERMVYWKLLPEPTVVSFQKHIRPIFEALSGLQWVNLGFASVFGAGAPHDFARLMERLANPSSDNAEFRQRIFEQFRDPSPRTQNLGKHLWPQFYGDALDSLPGKPGPDASTGIPAALASLSPLQLGWLRRWAAGDFTADAPPPPQPTLADVPLADRPAALTEAALSYCLADAFHPGCEVTWTMRMRWQYSGPFRIRRKDPALVDEDFGDVLEPAVAVSDMGPLNGLAPGDMTRWMAIPWQTDTASCLSGYRFFRTSPSLPTFWPARVPNDVLAEDDFKILIDPNASPEKRRAAFLRREDWFRGFVEDNDIEQMILDFHRLGIIEEREGPADMPGIPATVWVESKPDFPTPPAAAAVAAAAPATTGQEGGGAAAPSSSSRYYRLRKFGKNRDY